MYDIPIREEYFEWLYQAVEGKGYRSLFEVLHDVDFVPIHELDDNRLIDGREIRYRFGDECNILPEEIDQVIDRNRCSVLEVMVGLAFRIEENIMVDQDFGDRTIMWFWLMLKSLGLYGMSNANFDELRVRDVLDRFINRDYEPNGRGGLFTIFDTDKDMRNIEIWYQMCMFFDKLLL